MLKQNKGKLILSSVVILLPIVAGLFLWETLPAQLATHWGVDGEANGWSSRAFAVFGMPAFMLVMHWLCMLVTALDPKNRGQNRKIFGLVFWICPLCSVFCGGVIYATAFGMDVSVATITPALLGLLFVVIGNYLPKCKQNHTIGIKVKWALENEENWNATHRVGGRLWVVGGLLMMAGAFLPEGAQVYVVMVLLLVLVVVPTVYSYTYYKKHS